jgi:diguanylate cyclase (GGDEF)-like protein
MGELLARRIEIICGFDTDIAASFKQASEFISKNNYFAVVADLNLPDIDTGGMVDYAIEKSLPVIVYTGDYCDELREDMWKKHIVDYVLKKDPESDVYIANTLKQLSLNKGIDIIIADDSRIFRNKVKTLLEAHLFRVHTCENGNEAYELCQNMENLRMVISDYMMPDMNGFELFRILRKKFPKDKVALIGMSREGSQELAAKFIKYGANDFILKPFSPEQFYCRVNMNINTLALIDHIRDMSFKDYLTGLFNRRYFFEYAKENFHKDMEKSVVILDVDHFKKVNDTYGHDCGDAVLKCISKSLKKYIGDDGLVCRFGGEEFCIYMADVKDLDYYEGLRKIINECSVSFEGNRIQVTASLGVCTKAYENIDQMISLADKLLYEAKSAGRNKVVISD